MQIDNNKLTRIEIIDNGREFVKYIKEDEYLDFSIQDEGKTLKVFIKKTKDREPDFVEKYINREKTYKTFFESERFYNSFFILVRELSDGIPSDNTKLVEEEFSLLHNSVCSNTEAVSTEDNYTIVNTYKGVDFMTSMGQGTSLWAKLH